MTLGRRLTFHLAMLLLCLLLTAGVGLSGMLGLRQDYSLALDHYERLRQLYQVGFHLESARLALSLDFPDPPRARVEARRALEMFQQQSSALKVDPALTDDALAALQNAAAAMQSSRPARSDLDAPLAKLNAVSDALREQITAAQSSGDHRDRRTLLLLAIVAAFTVVASVVIGLRQLNAVMRPLSAIAAGVKRIAAGQFEPPLQLARADDEFAALSTDFNNMAGQLHAMYRQLNERIESATRSLVQSERLAGVGLLAAGVAHEINNPLSIITGRIELMLAKPITPEVERPLRVVLEEAFRCKQIIDRLLLLSRGASGERTNVQLDRVVHDVVQAVRAMTTVRERQFDMRIVPVTVYADAGELRQVLLNLLINAIQFTRSDGRVCVCVEQANRFGQVTVEDNGAGIAASDLPKLFEPFYSTPNGEKRGTGLGLAISKAIVESHGGQIEAHSDGPNQGSRFVVRWPINDHGRG